MLNCVAGGNRKMLKTTPNFHFRCQCMQAIELYRQAFGAKVKELLCNSDANPQDYQVKDESHKDLVYHAEIYIGNQRMFLSDLLDDTIPAGNTLSLVVTFETTADVMKAYEIIKDGAILITPMTNTTYSSCFVSLIDKFGMRWELMTEQTER